MTMDHDHGYIPLGQIHTHGHIPLLHTRHTVGVWEKTQWVPLEFGQTSCGRTLVVLLHCLRCSYIFSPTQYLCKNVWGELVTNILYWNYARILVKHLLFAVGETYFVTVVVKCKNNGCEVLVTCWRGWFWSMGLPWAQEATGPCLCDSVLFWVKEKYFYSR